MDPSTPPGDFPAPYPVTADDRTRILPRNLATSGVLPGNTVIQLGSNNILIDGKNRRITMNDGVNDRILLGNLPGGF